MNKRFKRPNNYWTKEKCQEEASKYKTRYEFKKNSNSAWSSTHRNGWMKYVLI